MTATTLSADDPIALIRSKQYRVLLVLAAIIGIVVSIASWAFLEAVAYLQEWTYQDLPTALGFDTAPWWWPLPVLGLAGVLIAVAIDRLPGRGGHEPSQGLKTGTPTTPLELPGVVLAALASVGLGMVLGPEAPLIAIGMGLGILSVKLLKKDAPQQMYALMAAAASFAAISSLFGSPVVGAVIIIEAAGLGGATLPLVLLPGLMAAGIGSLVFIGMGSISGLSTSAYAIAPLNLPTFSTPDVSTFLWIILLSIVVAAVIHGIAQFAQSIAAFVGRRRLLLTTLAALGVGVLAISFTELTDQSAQYVLFSGQTSMGELVNDASTLSISTLILILVFKGAAYGLSLGVARGGPTFPAMYLGIAAGLLASHLPGLSETPAVAALMGAATVAMLRLPLSSVVIAAFVSQASLAVTPYIIVAVVVGYIVAQSLPTRRTSTTADRSASPAPPDAR